MMKFNKWNLAIGFALASSVLLFAQTGGILQSQTMPSVTLTNTTNQLVLGTTNTTTINAPAPSAGITLGFPTNTGAMPTGYSCGSALAANGACANTAQGGNFHVIFGTAVLTSNASTITGISPAFTSTTSFFCVANDITTRANPVQAVPASASTLTLTNTTGATDTVSFFCAGN